jgi:antitoxin ParD1/3/4
MSKVEKLSVALTAELVELVREAVQSGDYASTSEVIRDALREWSRERDERAASIAYYRRLVAEGLASGPAQPARTFEEIKGAGLKRLAKRA